MKSGRIIKRYSLAFKQKVVEEIERGKYTITEARQIYNIGGADSIQNWIRRMGKFGVLNEVVMVKIKGEKSRIRELQQQISQLKEALAEEHLKNKCLEKIIELAGAESGIDIKKNSGGRSSAVTRKKKK